jgi:hypothetical protein
MKPVLFLVYKRIELVKQVFESIKAYKPKKLYLGADGPKNDIDKLRCLEVRDYIISQIDWDCSVQTLFRTENLGSSLAVSSAITWFFEHEEEGIILEDDCLPTKSFFTFCETMLDRYRDNDNVMHIAGCNCYGKLPLKGEYFYSKYSLSWGWATWRSKWLHFDINLTFLSSDNYKVFFWSKFSNDYNQYLYWLTIYENILNGKFDCWDYQWLFSIWKNNGVSVIHRDNFIKNIGFALDALHTKNINSSLSNLITFETLINKNKLKSKKENKLIDSLIFYYVFKEEENTTINNVSEKVNLYEIDIIKLIKDKKLSIRYKIHSIIEFLKIKYLN